MRTVISIDGKTKQLSKAGKEYTITYVTLDDGGEAEFYGTDIHVGDKVMVAFDWGKIKAIKPKNG